MAKQSTARSSASAAAPQYHIPVLLAETLAALAIRPDGVYVDCTMGGAGHSKGILAQLGPTGRLVAFDQDADAAANMPADPRVLFVPENFRHLQRFLRLHGLAAVDGILADLGVSSHQFDEAERGFSYRFDAALDMRMDRRQPVTAASILNQYDTVRLQQILSAYGEVTNARTLAAALVAARQQRPFASIADLLQVLEPLAKGNPHRYYAQVFQALRIEVNDELGALKEWLQQLSSVLKPGGRVAVITFHSLEDRLVKTWFRDGAFEVAADPLYGHRHQSPFRLVNKKPIEAGADELKRNERSRSARLRVAELLHK
ncbi:MAG: 16S rRNA (cytosine(1402)-N(4))-methyltransferase RsmH [Chitinophagaceae bacterium]|nr:16S rRNA (cytosine(1402)-N(4))-methyltransferase RsmH [Chitinophagaceae bacterium]